MGFSYSEAVGRLQELSEGILDFREALMAVLFLGLLLLAAIAYGHGRK